MGEYGGCAEVAGEPRTIEGFDDVFGGSSRRLGMAGCADHVSRFQVVPGTAYHPSRAHWNQRL
jgi:hypothetical protein